MTNEEKAKQLIRDIYPSTSMGDFGLKEMLVLEAMKWKDEQFSIEKGNLIKKCNKAVNESSESSAVWMKERLIEKAAEWLIKGGYFVNNTETIEDLRKAMEE